MTQLTSLLLLTVHLFSSPVPPPVTIELQPYRGMPESDVRYVYSHLKQVYPYVTLLPAKALPRAAYYAPRGRYKADTILRYQGSTARPNTVVVGLTEKDISTTKGNVSDWGVMGLGANPGNSCVVSSFRLSKRNRQGELFKVAIHELGHTQGLPHCLEKTCFMRDAEGHNPTGEEKEFCARCKGVLRSRGWKL